MTREDIEKAAKEWWLKCEPGYLTAADFALAMVRRHNEECAKIAEQAGMYSPAAIREAKP